MREKNWQRIQKVGEARRKGEQVATLANRYGVSRMTINNDIHDYESMVGRENADWEGNRPKPERCLRAVSLSLVTVPL